MPRDMGSRGTSLKKRKEKEGEHIKRRYQNLSFFAYVLNLSIL